MGYTPISSSEPTYPIDYRYEGVSASEPHSEIPAAFPISSADPVGLAAVRAVSAEVKSVAAADAPRPWHERAVTKLSEWDIYVDIMVPHLTETGVYRKVASYVPEQISSSVQSTYAAIQSKINEWAPDVKAFQEWLRSNGNKDNHLFEKVAIFLAKLPLRAAFNILNLLYQMVSAAVYAVQHPARAAMQIAKCLVLLVNELTKPETWTKIGVGMLGASLGQSLVGNPIAPLALIIGAIITFGGLTAGAIKAAVQAQQGEKWQAALDNLKKQAVDMPEVFATALLMGLMLGAIQKAQYKAKTEQYLEYEKNASYHGGKGMTHARAVELANEYADWHGLPRPNEVVIDGPSGHIGMDWRGDSYNEFISNDKLRDWLLAKPGIDSGWGGKVRLYQDGARWGDAIHMDVNCDASWHGTELANLTGRVKVSNVALYKLMHPELMANKAHTMVSAAGAAAIKV